MKKRIFSGLLAALMLTALLPSAALAATTPSRDEAAQVLAALDIMVGDTGGNLNLGATVTRAEFTKLVMAASRWKDSVGSETAVSPYPDVPRSNWAAPWIQAAVDHNLVSGYLDGTFRPSNSIKLAEGVVMVLRLLGYDNGDFSGAFPAGQMSMYRTLELNRGISSGQNDTITRQDALYLFYNLLTAKNKDGVVYLNVIRPNDKLVTASNEIDQVALLNSAMSGPVVVAGGWQNKIPFDVATATVYRSGTTSTFGAIATNDVVYWSVPMRTLWVYTNRATGTIEEITPASAPTSVKIGGKVYSIETTSAALSLSDLGAFRVGDSVTLLLGRDNRVAAATASSQTSATVQGMITDVQPTSYTDAAGNVYTTSTITLKATDGNTYTYPWDAATSRKGALVQVTTGNGAVVIKRLSSSTIAGKVSSNGTRLGDYDFAANVEILDTYGDTLALRVFPARLGGVEITAAMVRFYQLDADGKISKLILKDVTGDYHQYGVITAMNTVNTSMLTNGSYQIDVNGKQTSIDGVKVYNIKMGPCIIKRNVLEIDLFANLTELRITDVDGTTILADNREYPVSENIIVYEVKDDKYYPTTLALVDNDSYSLTGFYDKPQAQGGCVRIILAR